MAKVPVSQSRLSQQLFALGVRPGGVLLAHCSFSRVGPVEGGPMGLISALRAVLGPEGTLVMPSMTGEDDRVFDPAQTHCIGMGVVADTFWRMPGVQRSDSPHAFAAAGPQAMRITAPHPPDSPHGLDSPVGRVYQVEGQVLLLGVGHDANTCIHLAEYLAGVRYRRRKHLTLMQDDRPVIFHYDEIDHCCQKFNLVDQWLDAKGLQKKATVGHAQARLMRSRDVVEVVLERLRQEETVFLHPFGMDDECDEARASLSGASKV